MRILFDYEILWIQRWGGISRYFYEIIRGIKKENKDIHIDIPVIASENEYFKNMLQYRKFPQTIGRILNELITAWKIILANISGKPYDIIHMTYYLPLIWPAFVNWKKTKLVITVHDMTHEYFMKEDRRTINAKKKLMYKADGIVAVSEWTKSDILKLYPEIEEEKIQVIYHGNSLCEEIGNIEGDIPQNYILYVGMRDGYKNYSTFIKAFSSVAEKQKNLYCICAGGGDFTDEERKSIKELDIENRVIQKNVSDKELMYLYKNARCFVFPSLYEGFGIPILEAWGNDCPIICSNRSCFGEIAEEAAMYVDGEDEKEMADAILKLVENETLCQEMIVKGQQRLKKYSWDKASEETIRFYKKVLRNA